MKDLTINGTLIWYYYVCKREVWLIAHGIEAEQDNVFVSLGRFIHETVYKSRKKELLIDGKIKIDLLENRKVVGEIKKSSKFLKSAMMQLVFYLYYMKREKGKELEGELLIPEERKRVHVKLNRKIEKEIENAIKEIEEIIKLPKPPKVKKSSFCRNCAYKDFCWS